VLAREGTVLNNEPPFYGSTIGLDLEHVSVLLDVFATGYPLAKWTLNVKETIEEQLSRIRDLGIGWESIALDAHGRLNVSEVKRIHKLAPGLSWLEDPFPSKDDDKWTIASAQYSNQFPPLVVGEYIDSVERLEEMAAFPTTHAVNLEVERLGLTKSVLLIRSLKAKGRTCYLHGRALIPSSHLAIAYPDVVQWVENHLAFALERLATVHRSDSVYDACAIVSYCLEQEGIGVKPSREAGFSVSRIPL
jgi:L-alanine-DL-glutamate epimerase-like enolase superfamily enzyme